LVLVLIIHEILAVNLVNFKNYGVSFGMMKNMEVMIVLLNVILLAYIWLNLKLELALIWVGGMGNMVDRLKMGYVRDYWNFSGWFYNNIYDWLIAIGLLLLIINLWNTKGKK